ncbi:hypothetical protein B5S32_g4809 [[Candida] boidinii]|nr:hypothetical protein B5S32_g4809 [[Candida] boidinii]
MAPSNTKSNITLREDILRFKLSVKRDRENSLIENSIKDKINSNNSNYNDELGLTQEELNNSNSFTNRGNKLLFTSDTVDFTRLNSYRDSLKTESIDEILPSPGHFKRRRLVIVDKNQRLNDIIQKQLDAEFGPVNDDKKRGNNGNSIAITQHNNSNDDNYDDDDDDDDDDDYYNDNNVVAINLLKSIDLQSILGPITDPTDIINRKTINSIYQNNHLKNLANETIHIIEKEQDTVNQLSKLMNVFLGDDPLNNLSDNLLLPKYDHDLDLFKKFDNIDKIDKIDSKDIEEEDKKDEKDEKDEKYEKDEDITNDEETDESKSKFDDRRITRSQSITDSKEDDENDDDENSNEIDATIRQEKYGIIANKLIKDPFFKLPEYIKDFNYGISKNEDAEDSRQLIQIALQRNEEFIRSLSNIRNGFIRADRIKDNILKWCREINDDQN